MDLLKLNIKLDDELRKIDIEKDLDINADDISNELIKQPSKYAYYASLSEYAHKRVSELENEINIMYSHHYQKIVKAINEPELDDNGKPKKVEKLTETAIKNIIINKKSYDDLIKQQIEMEYIYNVLKAARQAFEQRCQMLIQIGSMKRQELDSTVLKIKQDMANKIASR